MKVSLEILRYFNFKPSFKLRWCRSRELFGSQLSVTKRVAVQTLLWSLEFVIKIIIEHDTITELFKGCFEISISVIVKHVQSIGIIRAFCLPGGTS